MQKEVRYRDLRVEDFTENAYILTTFEATTVGNIKRWFYNRGDVLYDDEYLAQPELPYKADDPLYVKMVHRFRYQCNGRIAQFYHQIDPMSQKRLTFASPLQNLYLLLDYDLDAVHLVVDFLAWLSNMKGTAQIDMITGKYNDTKPAKLEKMREFWRKTPIAYFLSLPIAAQSDLLDEYNNVEVKALNKLYC